MTDMHIYSTIPALIRAALGDEIEIDDQPAIYWAKVNKLVQVSECWTKIKPYELDRIQLFISEMSDDEVHYVELFINVESGRLDLDKFRTKYAEIIEAWKPHEECADQEGK